MERYTTRTIDELWRIVLPSDIRKKFELEPGVKLSMTVMETIAILHRGIDTSAPVCAVCEVSDLGTIELPSEMRQRLAWKVKDRIAFYNTDYVIFMKLAENE